MSDAPRQILMPGESAQAAATAEAVAPAPERKKPGPKPRAAQAAATAGPIGTADGADDDLADFDSDELPPAAPAPATVTGSLASLNAEQRLAVQQLVAEGIRAAMSSRDPATAVAIAAKNAQPQRLPTQGEAFAMCEDSVKKGIRPRAILTADGWYAHPEMARVRDHGVAKLQVD